VRVVFAQRQPNHADLPNRPAFTTADRAMMISGRECKVVNDPNREERIAHGDS